MCVTELDAGFFHAKVGLYVSSSQFHRISTVKGTVVSVIAGHVIKVTSNVGE